MVFLIKFFFFFLNRYYIFYEKSVLVFLTIITISCSENKFSKLDTLIGTWKIEGKEQFEVWEKKTNNNLAGYSYKLINHKKIILETLSIKIYDSQIVYEATVPNQNEGKTIQFILNSEIDSCLSFENNTHDFPNKIRYKNISDEKIEVSVGGNNGKGFSYIQKRENGNNNKNKF
ncbi:MAG: hypothetical protein JEY94_07175 [Melioribacteraceae bacterium]|nr:hypothetical protein [Melioribacteraceae bacterium]